MGGRGSKGGRAWAPGLVQVAILTLLVVAHLGANLAWVARDRTLRAMDMGCHVAGIGELVGLLSEEPGRLLEALAAPGTPAWPTAGYLPAALGALLVGPSTEALRLLNIGFLILLFGAVAHAGARLGHRWTGVLAVALLGLYPAIYGVGRQVGVDLPATAVGALCVALMLETRGFSRAAVSLAWGVALGWLMLTRPLATLTLAPAALLALAAGVHQARTRRWRPALNAGAGAALGAVLSAPWWMGRLGLLWHDLASHGAGLDSGGDNRVLYYFGVLPLAVSPLLLLGAGLALPGIRRLMARVRENLAPADLALRLALLAAWLLGGLALLSLLGHRFHRYLFPLLPALALLTAAGLLAIPHRAIRRAVIAILLAGSAASWLLCSFAPGQPLRSSEHRPEDDVCSPCGFWEFSGPPAFDPYVLALRRTTALVGGLAPAGRGAVIRLPRLPNPHGRVVTRAQVSIDLPHALLTALPWSALNRDNPTEDPVHTSIPGGANIPRQRRPERCFTLQFGSPDEPVAQPPPPPGATSTARLLLDEHARGWAGPLRIRLWDHGPCGLSPLYY